MKIANPALAASIIYSSFGRSLRALFYLFTFRHHKTSKVAEYENRFAKLEGTHFCVATSLARVGLFQVLQSLDLKPGDTVLLTPVNIPEMRAVLNLLRLNPVYVDFGEQSLFPCAQDLEAKARTSNAKAFFLTYLAGQIGELDSVRKICDDNNLTLIQDCTQANVCKFGGKPLASWGDFSIFSTCELKFIYAYRGAMICVDDPQRYARLREVVSRVKRPQGSLTLLSKWLADTIGWLVLEPKWFATVFHRLAQFIFKQNPLATDADEGIRIAGVNLFGNDSSRMKSSMPAQMLFKASDFEAELGSESMSRLTERVEHHRSIGTIYDEKLSARSVLPRKSAQAESSTWRYPVLLGEALRTQEFITFMRRRGIVVEKSGLTLLSPDVPKAKTIIDTTVFLPCHTGVDTQSAIRIADAAVEFLSN